MKKKDFTDYLKNILKDLPLEKQKLILEKIRKEWLPEYINNKFINYSLCEKCGKYSLTKSFQTTSKKEIFTETTYTDAGYGDTDKIGEVEYLIHYSICPICSHEKVKDRYPLRVLNERYRR